MLKSDMHKIYLIIKLNKREKTVYTTVFREIHTNPFGLGYIRLIKKDTQESDRNDCLKGRKMRDKRLRRNIFYIPYSVY